MSQIPGRGNKKRAGGRSGLNNKICRRRREQHWSIAFNGMPKDSTSLPPLLPPPKTWGEVFYFNIMCKVLRVARRRGFPVLARERRDPCCSARLLGPAVRTAIFHRHVTVQPRRWRARKGCRTTGAVLVSLAPWHTIQSCCAGKCNTRCVAKGT